MRTPAARRRRERQERLGAALEGVTPEDILAGLAKDSRIDLRLPRREKEVLKAAAKAANLTLTDFIRQSALLVAGKLVKAR